MTFEVPNNIGIKELLTEHGPRLTREAVENQGRKEELQGTQFTLVVDVEGELYSYTVNDGTDVQVKEGEDIPNAMVRYKISKDDFNRMIENGDLDMLLGIMSDLNKQKYETLKKLEGFMTAVLSNDDGSEYTIQAAFNDAQSPQATFRMKTSDSAALMRKEDNPVNLFMSGAMKIEGDMAFAMATQPLFT
ncbi:MAG: SCP2 sterol-binding domain-containing protein [Thermodesulfobacteriota bacterium]